MPAGAWRDYRLASLGIPPGAADDMSAVRLDWVLAIDDTVRRFGHG